MKLAILGPKNTFSDVAADLLNLNIDKIYYDSIEEVMENIVEFGLVPIENALDGYINIILDELILEDFHIIKEIYLPIEYSLVGKIKALEDIKKIFVQFKAKPQTNIFLKTLNKPIIITESNMQSYFLIKDDGDAAVVPKHVKTDYFRVDDISDVKNNYTKFFLIKKGNIDIEIEDKNKCLFFIHSDIDKPGLLLEILEGFKKNNMNLVSIISRPNRSKLGTYNFFIELNIKSLCDFLDNFINLKYKILGIF